MNILRYFKRYRFNPKKFRLGMRTFKTGLAVFLVLLLFYLWGWEGMQIAALTAVFSLREDFDQSVHFGMSRIIANSIGGFYALLYFVLERVFPSDPLVLLLGVPIGVMLTIMTCVATNTGGAIIGGAAAFLIISLSIPYGDSVLYVFTRVFETFFGVFIAILVNYDMDRIRAILLKKPR
ncbi:aromatic acid exporter family protein [Streptococcus sp. NLN76]|uniref:FUSC family protein n=1 Tax=Streptococcus sp. NLN76 TaxID=2822800 RepID=UPI0018ABC7EF|nr:aromatic acid exporter family protein [Streptococcus sp. NLN76]MBF8970753.1 FUSC family protein [Streptococcus sp. NLN76]